MSLVTPQYFLEEQGLYRYMRSDTFASVMSLPKDDVYNRITLAKKVLHNSDVSLGFLSGRITKDMYHTIGVYIRMISIVYENKTEPIPKPKPKQN